MKKALNQNSNKPKSKVRAFIRFLLLLISLGVFSISVAQIGQHWNYQEVLSDVSEQITQTITPTDLSNRIQEAIDNSEFEDAKSYLRIAKEYQFEIDYNNFESRLKQKDKTLNRVIKNASDFTTGFVNGKSANLAGVAGAVSADFTVVGDVRDLRNEYLKYQAKEPINELIVVLSGTGIGLTAMTVASLGAAAPAKTGVSTIKLAVKSQRLTARFQEQLLKLGRKVFNWRKFTRGIKQDKSISSMRRAVKIAYRPKALKPLEKIAGQVNTIRKSSSTADTLYMLKYVENTNDLRHLEKVTLKHGAKTKGIFKLLGKATIRTTRVLKRTTELLLSIISSIVSGLLSLFFFIGRRVV
ncbi:MAG: hypothetical protein ACI88H_001827 [Cocleimonas sp.]